MVLENNFDYQPGTLPFLSAPAGSTLARWVIDLEGDMGLWRRCLCGVKVDFRAHRASDNKDYVCWGFGCPWMRSIIPWGNVEALQPR